MKTICKYGHYVISCMAAAAFCACTFLDEEPMNQYSKESIYTEARSCRGVLAAGYAYYAAPGTSSGAGRSCDLYELSSNSFILNSIAGSATWRVGIVGITPTNDPTYMNRIYLGLYKVVMIANDMIQNMDLFRGEEDIKTQLLAEARFLRGIAYFDLVRLFGRVPLVLQNDMSYPDQPRAPIRKVYEQIISDFQYAWNMPDKGKEVFGYPHRWASKAYLAKVYATMAGMDESYFLTASDTIYNPSYTIQERVAYWDSTYVNAKKIYESDAYKLTETYAELWNNKSNNTSESILELQHSNGNSPVSWMTDRTLGPTNQPNASPLMYKGEGNTNGNWGKININRWVFGEHWLRYGSSKLMKANPTPPVSPAYINSNNELFCDPRINVNYLYYNDYNPEAPELGSARSIFPASNFANTNNNGAFCFLKKYWYYDWKGANNGNCNNIVYRYADLILLMAEAANELGNTSEAINLVNNNILKRARMMKTVQADKTILMSESPQPADWPPGISQDSIRSLILYERIFELLGEGHELFDARRRGAEWAAVMAGNVNFWNDIIAAPATTEFILHDKTIRGWNRPITAENFLYIEYRYPADPNDLFYKKILHFPFPRPELQKNSAIPLTDQNYGWPQ